MIRLIECPRDAMQGLSEYIPAVRKAEYINQLLRVGFDTIDFGSFVSPKAIPQLRDTAEVMDLLDVAYVKTKLLAIVANTRGGEVASAYEAITYLGFPLSISETFQMRNTHKSIEEAFQTVAELQETAARKNKVLVVYLSMGFGNPYGDPYTPELVENFIRKLLKMNISIISLADTVGLATPGQITYLFSHLNNDFPEVELGAHLHSHPAHVIKKIAAAYDAGCRRFDSALKGFGGCPFAEDELVGNVATETLLAYLQSKNDAPVILWDEYEIALQMADQVFSVKTR